MNLIVGHDYEMNQLFETPISTSNLRLPEFEHLWEVFSRGFDESESLVSGQLVRQLEDRLCQYHDAKYCVTFSTGFWALVSAIILRSIPGRSEIVIPSLTYRRLADAIYWTGHTPVLVDVDRNNLSICPVAVKNAISPCTALVLGVHPIVNCCDVNRLLGIANEYKVPIVFDAVESVHETIDSKRVGSFDVGEVFSFHASKLINGLEGGYVCTGNREFRDQLLEFREGPRAPAAGGGFDTHDIPAGINGVLNDVHAAFALAGVEEIDRNVKHNRQIYYSYCEELGSIEGVDVLPFDESERTSFKNVVAKIGEPFPIGRDELVSELNEWGILARAHYSPALHTKRYRYPVKVCEMPITNEVMFQFVNLPCGSCVSPSDVQTVCHFLREISSQGKA